MPRTRVSILSAGTWEAAIAERTAISPRSEGERFRSLPPYVPKGVRFAERTNIPIKSKIIEIIYT